ncbi:zinc-ribbon domain containing protein [Chloroflexota bacterium]
MFFAGEQAFYYSKSLSQPKRCKSCREKRRRLLVPDERRREGR